MKISYKTYFNERLKQVSFHGQLTHPLYIQVTYNRKPIYFKSYYFELFSKPRYLFGLGNHLPVAPTLDHVITLEVETIQHILAKHSDDFSLSLFKSAYEYYSRDLCEVTEAGFISYLRDFLIDEGLPTLGQTLANGIQGTVAYDLVHEFKRILPQAQFSKLVNHSVAYGTPYLFIYGFMRQVKHWPKLILTPKDLEQTEMLNAFAEYLLRSYPGIETHAVLDQIGNWSSCL